MGLKRVAVSKWLTRLALIVTIAISALLLYFINGIDSIINVQLYSYGLQFNPTWYDPSHLLAMIIYSCLGIIIVLSGSSLVVGLRLESMDLKRATVSKWLTRLVLIVTIATSALLLYFINGIDQIVNVQLYSYGLQANSAWLDPFQLLAMIIYSCLGIIIVLSGSSLVVGLRLNRKEDVVEKEVLSVSKTTLKSTRSHKNVWGTLGSIAIRNIPKRKLRNALTVLSIILGVSLIVGVNIAFDSVYDQFGMAINGAIGNVDISIRSSSNLPFNQSILNTINETAGVADYYSRLSSIANASEPDKLVTSTLIGVSSTDDFDYSDNSATNITGQRQLTVNGTDAVVDDRLNYTIGQEITIQVTIGTFPITETSNYTLKVVGFYHVSSIEKQYGGIFGQGYSGYRIFADLTKVQTIMNCTNKINTISIKLTDSRQTTSVVSDLNSKLGSDYMVNPVKESLLKIVSGATSGLQSGLQIMSVMALCVAIVIVLNTMYMNIGERTHEIGILRSQGASTLQVFWIFFSESLILGIIGVAIGLVLGLFVTDAFRYLTSRIFQAFSPDTAFTLYFPATTVNHLILGAVAGILTVMIGGLLPSLSACRTSVISALRPSMRKPGKQRTALKLVLIGLPMTIFGIFIYILYDTFFEWGIGLYMVSALAPIAMIGVTFLAAGLLRSAGPAIEKSLFAFRKTNKIISRNVERNLLRSTICFALIGMSLSLVVVISGAQTGTVLGVENTIRSFSSSDLTVMSDKMISKNFSDIIVSENYGVNASTPVLVTPAQTIIRNTGSSSNANSSSTILAIDTASYSKVMNMTFAQDTPSNVFNRLNDSDTIILTSPLAESLGVMVNDNVEVRTVDYSYGIPILTWKNFTVVGIAQGAWMDIMSFGNFALSEASYISYSNLNETFPNNYNYNDSANLFFVKVNPNVNVGQIKDSLLYNYGNDYSLSITTYDDAVQRVQSSIDQIFYILYSIVIFAVINSGIGVAAIMIMNISERRREIGIFRSQGMSKSQVMTSIIGEAAFLGVVGFIMGIVLGLMFHRVTVSYMALAGFAMPFILPVQAMVITLFIAVLTAVISAIYPANKASNQNIVEAIRT